jgi:hypothetical protein
MTFFYGSSAFAQEHASIPFVKVKNSSGHEVYEVDARIEGAPVKAFFETERPSAWCNGQLLKDKGVLKIFKILPGVPYGPYLAQPYNVSIGPVSRINLSVITTPAVIDPKDHVLIGTDFFKPGKFKLTENTIEYDGPLSVQLAPDSTLPRQTPWAAISSNCVQIYLNDKPINAVFSAQENEDHASIKVRPNASLQKQRGNRKPISFQNLSQPKNSLTYDLDITINGKTVKAIYDPDEQFTYCPARLATSLGIAKWNAPRTDGIDSDQMPYDVNLGTIKRNGYPVTITGLSTDQTGKPPLHGGKFVLGRNFFLPGKWQVKANELEYNGPLSLTFSSKPIGKGDL